MNIKIIYETYVCFFNPDGLSLEKLFLNEFP